MPRKYIRKNVKRKYDDDNFQLAIEAVAAGSSIRDATNRFHVPYTTLNSHVNSNVLYEKSGRPPKFSKDEESCLEQAALVLQAWGIPLSINEFTNLAKQYAFSLKKHHLFPSETPTYDWIRSFLKRHQNLVLKKSQPLEKKRAAVTKEQITNWFDLLRKIIEVNDLEHRPAQLFNCDETGFSDCISYSKVIVHRQTINPYRIQGGTGGKSFTTVMVCASATGFLLPPYVVYKSKRLFQEWCLGGPPDTAYNNSKNGWMDQALFKEWFEHIFLQHTNHLPRPLVLIVDGHQSHFNVETLKLAVTNNVIILALPSNTTHILQPLDLVFFNALKITWKKILQQEYTRTKNKSIGKIRFPSLLNELWETNSVRDKNNIIKSFTTAGIFPLKPNAIYGSRILQRNTSSNISSSNVDTNNNQTNASSSSISYDTPSSTKPTFSFASSRDAISALDRVLDDTIMDYPDNDNVDDDADNDSDEDEDYVPNQSTTASSITFSSKKKQNSFMTTSSSTEHHPSVQTEKHGEHKQMPSRMMDIDTSDEDGNSESYTAFLILRFHLDDGEMSISSENNPEQQLKVIQKSRSKNVTKIVPQSATSHQSTKRKRLASKIIGFDTSDEDDDGEMSISSENNPEQQLKVIQKSRSKNVTKIVPQSATFHQSTKRKRLASKIIGFDTSDEDDTSAQGPPQSVKAITDTLQAIFGESSQQPPTKPTKRTVLKRSSGQIMTEKDVIEQLEEQKKKKGTKRSGPTTQQSNVVKRVKTQKNDSSISLATNSTITIESSSSPMVSTRSSVTTNSLPLVTQHATEPRTHWSSFVKRILNPAETVLNS